MSLRGIFGTKSANTISSRSWLIFRFLDSWWFHRSFYNGCWSPSHHIPCFKPCSFSRKSLWWLFELPVLFLVWCSTSITRLFWLLIPCLVVSIAKAFERAPVNKLGWVMYSSNHQSTLVSLRFQKSQNHFLCLWYPLLNGYFVHNSFPISCAIARELLFRQG